MKILDNLTKDDIQTGKFPLEELLETSFYYPSCGFDGGIVKHFSKEIQSFVYCDYATGEEEFLRQINSFRGYRLLGNRSLRQEELVPKGWNMQLPPNFNMREYYRYQKELKTPFAHWAVYERLEDFDENYGPRRFSLIYIGGEGVATYQAIYQSNKKSAKALAIIQPGTGFGFNWTDFTDKEGALAWVVMNNPYGIPDTVFYGGYGDGYDDFDWIGFQMAGTIRPYYSETSNGKVTVWKR